jgi:hypothetical protein
MAISRFVAAPLLGFIALMQAVRFVQAWPITVNGYAVPVWPSAVAAVLLATVAVLLWREGGARAGR